jgi:hypothetical protein
VFISIFFILVQLSTVPLDSGVCLLSGAQADSLLRVTPRSGDNAAAVGKLFVNKVFLKQSTAPRKDADSARYYFRLSPDSSATIQAYRLIADALRIREDGIIDKLLGNTNKRVTLVFQTADSLVRRHPQEPEVVFLIANLFGEAHKDQTNAKWYWNRASQLFEALQLFIQAEHLVDPEYRSPLVNPEICGMVMLNQAKLKFKLADEEKYAVVDARKRWEEVITRFPNTLAAANAKLQLEKYKM